MGTKPYLKRKRVIPRMSRYMLTSTPPLFLPQMTSNKKKVQLKEVTQQIIRINNILKDLHIKKKVH
jgi:hypothetical protein